MANIRDIRTRITAMEKMQKIVRAMKMISAAKLARATTALANARPYAEKLEEVLASVAAGVSSDAHPLIQPRDEVRKLDVVLFTSDRGLCGAFNSRLIKRAEQIVATHREHGVDVSLVPVGKRGREHFERRQISIPQSFEAFGTIEPDHAREVSGLLTQRYVAGDADETVLVYSRFESALSQVPTSTTLLPLSPPKSEDEGSAGYEVEPDPVSLLALLVPRAVEFALYRSLLETQAGEHGARMTAMDNATNNTEDLIRSFTLEMNKARQAQITQELLEIVSGAEAL